LDRVFAGEKSKPDIDCAGAPRQATSLIVIELIKFGKDSQAQYSIWRLLDLIALEVGVDIQERITKLKSFDVEKLRVVISKAKTEELYSPKIFLSYARGDDEPFV